MSHRVEVKTTTHTYCPKTSDSWCQYHTDYINQNLYKPGPRIAKVIKDIKIIYQDLTKDNDLVPAWHYTQHECMSECYVNGTCSKKYLLWY